MTGVTVSPAVILEPDWYIYQQQCPLYDAPGLPITWSKDQYQEGKNEYVAIRPELKKQIEELYQKHPEEARDSFGNDPFEVKNILKYSVSALIKMQYSDQALCFPTPSVI